MNSPFPTPSISVCIMTYNQAPFVAECLLGVLNQEWQGQLEIIVADDCSTDNTQEIIREFAQKHPSRIRPILHSTHVGITENYLAMHEAARGDFVAHMDG